MVGIVAMGLVVLGVFIIAYIIDKIIPLKKHAKGAR